MGQRLVLVGRCRTSLLIVQHRLTRLAPLQEHGAESLSTLAFAKRAAEVSLGKPVRRVGEPASKTQKLELQAAAEQAEAWQSRAHEAMAEAAIAAVDGPVDSDESTVSGGRDGRRRVVGCEHFGAGEEKEGGEEE